MSESPDESVAQLEDLLDGASRTLSNLQALNAGQAERVGERMDRLASQLLEIGPLPAMEAVHARLGTTPATSEDFASAVGEMGVADGEG